jgi:hypothetical protein
MNKNTRHQRRCGTLRIVFSFSCALMLTGSLARAAGIFTPSSTFGGPSISPGFVYQVAFVTSTTRNGGSSNINDYNNFAQSVANSVGAGGAIWKAIASTSTVAAKNNTLVSAPVYNTQGNIVATGFADLWDGSLPYDLIWYDEHGTLQYGVSVWTGTDPAGNISQPLGASPAFYGYTNSGSSAWMQGGIESNLGSLLHIYALSEPLVYLGTNNYVPQRWYRSFPPSAPSVSGQLGGGAGVTGGVNFTSNQIGSGGASLWGSWSTIPAANLGASIGASAAAAVNFTLPNNVQLWQFNSSGNIGGATDFTLAYDPATLGGIPAQNLQVYHYNFLSARRRFNLGPFLVGGVSRVD